MARPLRLELTGGVYHVVARGNERRAVFRDDRDREIYLERLAECRSRFQFRVLAYCLMDNHVHLALKRGPVALSRIMLALQSVYAQKFNRRHRRVGHLFQGRYKAFLDTVARAEGLSLEHLRRPGRSLKESRTRLIAVYIGRRDAGFSMARMARCFGREESTVNRGVRRLESLMARDAAVRARVEGVAARLAPRNTGIHD